MTFETTGYAPRLRSSTPQDRLKQSGDCGEVIGFPI